MSSLGGARVVTAGTLVVEGQPMSWRTRRSLEALGLAVPDHRSRQMTTSDLDEADVVVALAVEHVEYVRRVHPEAAGKTATLRRLCRDLPTARGPLADRLSVLRLGEVELEDWEDIEDPAGGELDVVQECAAEVVALVRKLHAII